MGVTRPLSIARWWGRLRLRTRIFLAFSALVLASLYVNEAQIVMGLGQPMLVIHMVRLVAEQLLKQPD